MQGRVSEIRELHQKKALEIGVGFLLCLPLNFNLYINRVKLHETKNNNTNGSGKLDNCLSLYRPKNCSGFLPEE